MWKIKSLFWIFVLFLIVPFVTAQADAENGTLGFNVSTCVATASLSNNSHSIGIVPGDDAKGCITNATFSAVGGSKVYWEEHINVRGRRHYIGVIALGESLSNVGAYSTTDFAYVTQATDLGDGNDGDHFNNDGGINCLTTPVVGDVRMVAVDNSTGK